MQMGESFDSAGTGVFVDRSPGHMASSTFAGTEQRHFAARGLKALLLLERERTYVTVHRVKDDCDLGLGTHGAGGDGFLELHESHGACLVPRTRS